MKKLKPPTETQFTKIIKTKTKFMSWLNSFGPGQSVFRDYSDNRHCLFAEFLRSLGYEEPNVSSLVFWPEPSYTHPIQIPDWFVGPMSKFLKSDLYYARKESVKGFTKAIILKFFK